MIELSNVETHVLTIDEQPSVAALQSRLEEIRRDEIRRTSTGTENPNSVICMYKVPPSLTGINLEAIGPKMVSIGPYNHCSQVAQESEIYKLQTLDAFLSRINTGLDLGHLFEAMRQMEKRARSCYLDIVPAMSSEEFIRMMILDGCFIIELFRQMKTGSIPDDDDDDKIKKDLLVMDLLKLENQLPFFILERLFNMSRGPGETDDSLALLALKFFNLSFPRANDEEVLLKCSSESQDVKHLLELSHKSYCIPLEQRETDQDQRVWLSNIFQNCMAQVRLGPLNLIRYCCATPLFVFWLFFVYHTGLVGAAISIALVCVWWIVKNFRRIRHPTPNLDYRPSSESIQCTTQLRPSGVKFRPLRADSFLAINFKNTVLEIPPIIVNDVTITFFINCIALEQSCPLRSGSYFTTYFAFMSSLIHSPRDVAFLSGDGIITSSFLHNDHAIVALFNKLGEKVYFDKKDCYLSKQFKDVEAYYNSHWGTFQRTYFSAPWSFISVVSACILLLLAGGQTIVSIMSYIKDAEKAKHE